MKIYVEDCYELEGDYQNQFLGNEVFPKPKYKKIKCAERSVNKVHYDNVYILQPLHYYYVTFDAISSESLDKIKGLYYIELNKYIHLNGLLFHLDEKNKRIFLFNASQNIVYLQKGVKIAWVVI